MTFLDLWFGFCCLFPSGGYTANLVYSTHQTTKSKPDHVARRSKAQWTEHKHDFLLSVKQQTSASKELKHLATLNYTDLISQINRWHLRSCHDMIYLSFDTFHNIFVSIKFIHVTSMQGYRVYLNTRVLPGYVPGYTECTKVHQEDPKQD